MKLSYEQFEALTEWIDTATRAAASIAQHPNDRPRVTRELHEVGMAREAARRVLEETELERRARELV